MKLLEREAFFTELSKLYANRKASGSVWVTMKRTSKKIREERGATDGVNSARCLVRATDGKKKKISCVVDAKDLERFQHRLMATVKVHTDGMQKRNRNRKKNTAT
eukprot:Plantae.Rhodophyta-Purpureofilum_apyrenoidigerum.ctg13197.p3 GENE.Plantae.Rhodophyta-Purpureofilum_apyrenoidigerum.ctg13197~~Plantae.Rhodophyta-Purpureofilum_apyrenoidigerum.ctg13197.p3  ORF type:complete len:105 (+),score=25.43 Plantae.Rhodophyta-Purpureofilum_apyrenoidigerum.ctg13197:159-473(+)